jgi:tRNA(Ile)-lysidine synthase TilS/MesJ
MANLKICNKCILDETAKEIVFDNENVCNFCHEFERIASITINRPNEVKAAQLEVELKNIKARRKGSGYDCILGVSGGVDSTYLALKAKEWGLNPLVVHFDNGWNSESAV